MSCIWVQNAMASASRSSTRQTTGTPTRGARTLPLLAALLAVSLASGGALAQVDLIAWSLEVPAPGTAHFGYEVDSAAAVGPYTIEFRVDADGDGVFEHVTSVPGMSAPGLHIASVDLSAPLTQVQNGALIKAVLNPDMSLGEVDPTNNDKAVTWSVDLEVVALVYDPAEMAATLSYAVATPTNVPPYQVDVWLDNGDTLFDPASDTLVVSQAGQTAAGSATLVVDFAGDPVPAGRRLFGFIDRADPADPDYPIGDVREAQEYATDPSSTNNAVHYDNLALTDLKATAMVIAPDLKVTLNYLVIAAGPVPAYDIVFHVWDDEDGDGLPETDQNITLAGDPGVGVHEVTVDLAGQFGVVGHGALIRVTLDAGGTVSELDESDADNVREATSVVELAAITLAYDPVSRQATLVYTVVTPTTVAPYAISFYLDRDGDDVLEPAGDDAPAVPVSAAPSTIAGTYILTGDFGSDPADWVGYQQQVFIEIDPGHTVGELDEAATNGAALTNNAEDDLQAVKVTYDPVSKQATLTYNVVTSNEVPAYTIEFFLDRNKDKAFDPAGADAPAVPLLDPIETTAGSFEIRGDFSAPTDVPATGQMIFAALDRAPGHGAVREPDEYADVPGPLPDDPVPAALPTNNFIYGRNLATTNLKGVSIMVLRDTAGNTTAQVDYTIASPVDIPAFKIQVGVDRDHDLVIDADSLLREVDVVTGLSPGEVYTAVIDELRTPLNAMGTRIKHDDWIVAVLIPGHPDDHVLGDNVVAQPQTVDIQADQVPIFSSPLQARVDYTVNSPANVAPFTIRLAVDKDGDGAGDSVLAEIAGDTSPGTHSTERVDLAAPLAAAGVTSDPDADVHIVASVDAVGTVSEANEANNTTAGDGKYQLDISFERLDFGGTSLDVPFDIDISFSLHTDKLPAGFRIGIYASTDGELDTLDRLLRSIDVAASAVAAEDTLDITATGLIVLRDARFQTIDFWLIVVLDDGDAIHETAENNNTWVQRNGAQSVLDKDGDGLIADDPNNPLSEGVRTIPATWIVRADRDPGLAGLDVSADSNDNAYDSDNDGLSDGLEVTLGTVLNDSDSDADGIPDGDEVVVVEELLQPGTPDTAPVDISAYLGKDETLIIQVTEQIAFKVLCHTDPRHWDTDGDRLSDLEEQQGFTLTQYPADATSGVFKEAYRSAPIKTDPLDPDSDDDGITDWAEVSTYPRFGQSEAEWAVTGDDRAGLNYIAGRNGISIDKPVYGIRTDPKSPDTDEDGIADALDPAPQINPARWGYNRDDDPNFTQNDIILLRAEIEALPSAAFSRADKDRYLSQLPLDVNEFQAQLLNFDWDNDGFLEAPDANGDGFPDFTRYSEATIEQFFFIDFSNDGSLDDGFDVGGLSGEKQPDQSDEKRFGIFRVSYDEAGDLGDGLLDLYDRRPQDDPSYQDFIPTDNCPTSHNEQQQDFDGDGLGDDCDADRDNDGVSDLFDPDPYTPNQTERLSPIGCGTGACGFGIVEGMVGCILGLVSVRSSGRYQRRRHPK